MRGANGEGEGKSGRRQPGSGPDHPTESGETRRGGVFSGPLGEGVDEEQYPYICRASGPNQWERCAYTSIAGSYALVHVHFPDGSKRVVPRMAVRRAKKSPRMEPGASETLKRQGR